MKLHTLKVAVKENIMKRKLTIEDLKEAARLKEGICLTQEYLGSRAKHRFRCKNGHEFSLRTDNAREGRWCSECLKGTIEEIAKIAEAKEGRMISSKYINARTPVEVECKRKHRWFVRPDALKRGQWCKKCADTRLAIEEMQNIAEDHGGKCISSVYVNAWGDLEWECHEKHRWMAPASRVKHKGNWCPECAKVTLKEIQELSIKRGGTCISSKIIGNTATAKLEFMCNRKHHFTHTIANVKYHGVWCKLCKKEDRYAELKATIEKKGGELLSSEYGGANVKHKCRCQEGHIWYTTPSKILNAGHWCNVCTKYTTQEKCRFLFQKLLGCEFVKSKKPLGKYELDGYNEKMALAFEYNGAQHYINNRNYYKTKDGLEKRIKMDAIKEELCRELSINLVVIPCYDVSYDGTHGGIIDDDKLSNYIVTRLDMLGIAHADLSTINLIDFYQELSELKKIQEIAKKKGGECRSTTYVNNRTHLEFICNEEHVWKAVPYAIKSGKWCPTCGREHAINTKRQRSLEEARKIANERGGQCLADEKTYINNHHPIQWECESGYRWFASLANVKRGTWCPHHSCSNNQVTQPLDQYKI